MVKLRQGFGKNKSFPLPLNVCNIIKNYVLEFGQYCSSIFVGRQSPPGDRKKLPAAAKKRKIFKNQKGLKNPFFY
jgi:hypothetical protein